MQTHAEDRAAELLAMTRRLCVLVGEEADAVRARKLDSTSLGWGEKERLVHAWRLEVSRVKADPAALAGIPATVKNDLRTASRDLEMQLEAHALALSASRTVTEGLVRSIAAEIASARSAPAGYGRSGAANIAANREASGLAIDAKA